MYRIIFLITLANAFIANNKISNSKLILHSSAAPPSFPPSELYLTDLGGENKEIRLLSSESANLVLEIWSTNEKWNTDESKLMFKATERHDSKDLFIGYCPEYNEKYTIRYLFHCRVVMDDNIYLSVINGVKCPFDDADISSYKFKDKIREAIPIIPISFTLLMKNPKFSLSWNLEMIEDKYQDDEDDEGDYI